MDHQQKVDEIIEVLLDTKYEWVRVTRHINTSKYTDIFHLVNGTNSICGVKIPTKNVTLDFIDISPYDSGEDENDCRRCRIMIKKNWERYGFYESPTKG